MTKQVQYCTCKINLAGQNCHTVIYGVSDNETGWWDNSKAAHLGFKARDSADVQRPRVEAQVPALDPRDPAAIYQGGAFVRAGPFED